MADETWELLEDSYWYVPPPYLGAFAVANPGGGADPVVVPRVDQTLWHLTDVVDGYVFGEVRTSLGDGWVTSSVVGSISPSGMVSFAFSEGGAGSELTIGRGRMVERDGDWYFEMQMTTGSGLASVSHWATMAEVSEGDRAWTSLPGFTGTGVAEAFDDDTGNDGGASDEQLIVFGGNGADQMDSYSSATGLLLYAEGGKDTLVGTALADGLIGGQGADTISGGDGDDDIYGQRGADVLKGQDGADLVCGGAGNDTLSGNDGSDIFVFALGDGNDIVRDFDAKGGGTDQDYIGIGSDTFDSLQIIAYGKDTVLDFGDGQYVTLLDVKASQVTARDFIAADVV